MRRGAKGIQRLVSIGAALLLAVGVSAIGPAGTASAATVSRPGDTAQPQRLADPGDVLPPGWQHSADEAVTVVGDASGLHVLAASEASGYTWRSVATLGDPAVDTSLWIGQACVTGSGGDAVVVYAPQQVTNLAGAQGALGRAAVVNLHTGAVRDLGGGFSVAYFDPGCGIGDTAVLTQGGWSNDTGNDAMSTALVSVNAATGAVSAPVRVAGQVTSAVPDGGQIVAAGGGGLEEIAASGATHLLVPTATVPFEVTPEAGGGLGYQTVAGKQARLWHLAGGRATLVATAAAGTVALRQTAGRVWLVGPNATALHGLPAQWQAIDAPTTAEPSTTGSLAVVTAQPAAPAKGYSPDKPRPVAISARTLTGKQTSASFVVPTTAAPPTRGTEPHTGSRAAVSATAGSPSTPVSDDRTCAIPINDPRIQAYQPSFPEVEWAADQAVQGVLTDQRSAGLYGSSLPAYTPQGMFPLPNNGLLDGGGGGVPAQVLLAVLTAESNLQQASRHVIQGQASNPLTSFNWYGNWINGETTNTGLVNWQAADCGYGIGQITSGMCLPQNPHNDLECQYQPVLSADQQLAVAVDYQANIAAATRALMLEWNQLWEDGIRPTAAIPVGDAPAAYIGEWYMAIWAYNSGLEPGNSKFGNTTGCSPGPSCTDTGGPGGNWGLGYADNPINPAYPPDRPTFPGGSSNPAPGGATYSVNWDLSHPQYWPYQEKVIAWAFDSIQLWDYSQGKYVQAFAFAAGNTVLPDYKTFCTSADNCDPSGVNTKSATAPDSCQLADDHCWWHTSANWPVLTVSGSCQTCGLGNLTYGAGAAIPRPEPIAANFQQTCTRSPLPANAVIVGDGGQAALGCPGQDWTSQGSFTWNFAGEGDGTYPSKIGFDQIGAGFGGHFWFGYTQPNDGASVSSVNPAAAYANQGITGTWTPPGSVTGWTRIEVAIPSYGANATFANYQVDPGGGVPGRNVWIDQSATAGGNTWVNLGDFYLGSGAHVSLSNVIDGINLVAGHQGVDIAWDAAAFIPESNPRIDYVAMGDSYSAGEGNPPYATGTDTKTNTCHRSVQDAYPMQVTLPGQPQPIAQPSSAGNGFSFIACSGAETTGISQAAVNPAGNPTLYYKLANANEQTYNTAYNTDWGWVQNATPWANNGGPVEGLQDTNPALTTSTALITISAGGNDSRFGDVLRGCLFTLSDCSTNSWYLTRKSTGAVDPMPLQQFEPIVIQYLQAHLVQTYLAINAQAPSAQIVVLGYPLLFPDPPTGRCNSDSIIGGLPKLAFSVAEQEMLNSFGDEMATAISQAVAQVKAAGVAIRYVDPRAAFAGHSLCSGDPWFLPLSVLDPISSYHPNPTGQQTFATLVNQCLAGKLSC